MQSYKKLCGLMLFALSTNGFVMPAFAAATQTRVAKAAPAKKAEKKAVGVVERAKLLGANVSSKVASALRAGNGAVIKIVSGVIALGAAGAGAYVWNKNKATKVASKDVSADAANKENGQKKLSPKQAADAEKFSAEVNALIEQKIAEGCSFAEAQAFGAALALSEAEAKVVTLQNQVAVAERKAKDAQSHIKVHARRQAHNNARRMGKMKADKAALEAELAREREAAKQNEEDADVSRRALREAVGLLSEADEKTARSRRALREAVDTMNEADTCIAEIQEDNVATADAFAEAVIDLERIQEELAIAEWNRQSLRNQLARAGVDGRDESGWTKSAELHERIAQERCDAKSAELDFFNVQIAQMDERMDYMQNQLARAAFEHGEDRAVIGVLNEALDALIQEKQQLEAETNHTIREYRKGAVDSAALLTEKSVQYGKMQMDLDALEHQYNRLLESSRASVQESGLECKARKDAEQREQKAERAIEQLNQSIAGYKQEIASLNKTRDRDQQSTIEQLNVYRKMQESLEGRLYAAEEDREALRSSLEAERDARSNLEREALGMLAVVDSAEMRTRDALQRSAQERAAQEAQVAELQQELATAQDDLLRVLELRGIDLEMAQGAFADNEELSGEIKALREQHKGLEEQNASLYQRLCNLWSVLSQERTKTARLSNRLCDEELAWQDAQRKVCEFKSITGSNRLIAEAIVLKAEEMDDKANQKLQNAADREAGLVRELARERNAASGLRTQVDGLLQAKGYRKGKRHADDAEGECSEEERVQEQVCDYLLEQAAAVLGALREGDNDQEASLPEVGQEGSHIIMPESHVVGGGDGKSAIATITPVPAASVPSQLRSHWRRRIVRTEAGRAAIDERNAVLRKKHVDRIEKGRSGRTAALRSAFPEYPFSATPTHYSIGFNSPRP